MVDTRQVSLVSCTLSNLSYFLAPIAWRITSWTLHPISSADGHWGAALGLCFCQVLVFLGASSKLGISVSGPAFGQTSGSAVRTSSRSSWELSISESLQRFLTAPLSGYHSRDLNEAPEEMEPFLDSFMGKDAWQRVKSVLSSALCHWPSANHFIFLFSICDNDRNVLFLSPFVCLIYLYFEVFGARTVSWLYKGWRRRWPYLESRRVNVIKAPEWWICVK